MGILTRLADAALDAAFRVTGSRAISDTISQRRVDRRWAEREAAHRAAGGLVVTVSDGSTYLVAPGSTVTVLA